MSGILYPILILTLFLIVQILTMMASRKAVLDKNKQQLLDSVNLSNKIYYNEELSILLAEQAELVKQQAVLIKQQGEKINTLTTNQNNMLKKAYPVGSIYISYHNTNPASLFGGTWVAYATGRTLVGVDTTQSEFNTIGKTGGEKTHVLSLEELPNATGYITIHGGENASNIYGASGVFYSKWSVPRYGNVGVGTSGAESISELGFNLGGKYQPHNNLQPYITVYMWRRTA